MWIFIVFNYQKWPMLVWVSSRWGVGSRFCDVIFFSANAIKRFNNNEWRCFVFEKSLNCRNEISNIVIFKRIKAQVLANKPAHFWTFFILFSKNVYKNLLKAGTLLKCKQHIFLGWYIIGTFEKRAPRIEKSQKIYLKLYTFTGKKKKKDQLVKILG